ncbi:MAG: glutamine--fructose-6-phosphate transaminase (isomerizing) [Bacilli bacterium]
MCGIIGYIGKNNALKVITDGLKQLEYRGYDSAGIAIKNNNEIKIFKSVGKIKELEKKIDYTIQSDIGIGHTRWATHGSVNITNSHPHKVGSITLVHNGIIENYEQLKQELIKNNYQLKSDTDTEIACGYIDYLYQKDKNIITTLNKIKDIFKGSYAFAILVDNDNYLYATRKDSPLIIAKGENENYLASDVPAILKYTNQYYLLDNYEIAILEKDDIKILKDNKEIKKELLTFNYNIETSLKNGYDHFMLKEINEQDKLVESLINVYLQDKKTLLNKMPDFKKYNQIHIVACGSAYHAGLVGKYLIEKYANTKVYVEVASEYRYNKLFFDKKTLVIIISQSGETADSLASLRIAKENKIDTLAIVNVYGSSIAREASKTLYINAGCEIAVATTKAYTLQLLMLSFIALAMGIQKELIDDSSFEDVKKYYTKLPQLMHNEIKRDLKNIAKNIYKKNNIFFIGRGIDYALSLEGSLKLKEISYIHSEAYPAGELKHGTISLIEKNTPVIAIVTDENIYEKTISNIKEVASRGAYVILIISKHLDKDGDFYNEKIVIENTDSLINSLTAIIPLQLLAYNIALLKGCDIDKPRNLAKSVTVE